MRFHKNPLLASNRRDLVARHRPELHRQERGGSVCSRPCEDRKRL